MSRAQKARGACSDEARKNMSEAAKARWAALPDETKRKMSQSRMGRKHTDETKRKMKAAHAARKSGLSLNRLVLNQENNSQE